MSKSKVIKQLPMKFTLSAKERQQNKDKNIISSLEDKYFCHYNNSLYMGGMKAYKKHGIGLILYDDEVTGIVSHSNDVPTGHNIIFKNGLLISKVYNIDKSIDIMFRMKRYLLQINYKNRYSTDGKGILIDYHLRKVHTISFTKAQLKQKLIIRNEEVLKEIFSKNLKKYIGDNHFQALTFNFNKPKDFQILKDGNIIKMGFQQDGKFKGLGIKLNYIISYQSPQFSLQIIQRGQYESSALNGFGQKRFQNKNLYYGEFKHNLFHGKGILCHPNDNKWVFGYFQAGNMKQIIKVNNQRNGKWYNSVLKQFHTLNDKWIDYTVQIPQQVQVQEKQFFNTVINGNDNSQELNESIKQKQKSQMIMKAITQRFVGSFNSQVSILLNNVKNSIQKLEEKKRSRSRSKSNSKSNSRQKSKQRSYSQSRSLSQSRTRQNNYLVSSKLQNNFIIQSPKNSKIDRLNSSKYSTTSKKKVIFQSEVKQHPIRIDLLPVLNKYQDPEITFRKDKQQDYTGYDKLRAAIYQTEQNNWSPVNRHTLNKSPSKLSGRSKSNNSPKRDNFFSSKTTKKPSNQGTIYLNLKKQRSKTPTKQYKDIRYQNYKKQFQPQRKQYRPRKYYKYLDEKDEPKLYDQPIRNGSILKRR